MTSLLPILFRAANVRPVHSLQAAPGPFLAGGLATLSLLLLMRVLLHLRLRRSASREAVLILGSSTLACELAMELHARRDSGPRLLGVVTDQSDDPELPSFCPVLGRLADLGRILREVRPDRIVMALWERRGRLSMRELLLARVQGIAIEEGTAMFERLTGRLAIESMTPSSLIFCEGFRRARLDQVVRRSYSFLFAVAGLLLFSPLMLLIALAIRLDSPGPIFFVQSRVGARGKRFKMIKFRTLRPDPLRRSQWIRDNGDRVTRIGKFLRKFRLDELPQLVNILRGDMNLLGPRPHPVSNFHLFTREIPYYPLRSVVRPGVTGWAQIRYGYANSLEEEIEKMRYDLYYIKHRNFWLDLRILAETLRVVFSGSGSEAARWERRPAGVPAGREGESRLERRASTAV